MEGAVSSCKVILMYIHFTQKPPVPMGHTGQCIMEWHSYSIYNLHNPAIRLWHFTSLSPQYIWCSVSDTRPVWEDGGWRWIKHGRFKYRLLETKVAVQYLISQPPHILWHHCLIASLKGYIYKSIPQKRPKQTMNWFFLKKKNKNTECIKAW